jgi:PncC family amidohydrolase
MKYNIRNFDSLRPEDILNYARIKAHRSAYLLIKNLSKISDPKNNKIHQLATAESLTGGLIFSTIVDIPIGSIHKYGCFGVYDTDAKRNLLGVKVKNLYTNKCAKEMAEGVLKNSNASIAISVSGNSMPTQNLDNIKKLGEVFIGIAGYRDDGTIICETFVYNFCTEHSNAINLCKFWYNTVIQNSKSKRRIPNDIITTSFVSNYIRNKTTEIALLNAIKFIKNNKLAYPSFLHESKSNPLNKKHFRSNLKTKCINENCNDITRKNGIYKNSALLKF